MQTILQTLLQTLPTRFLPVFHRVVSLAVICVCCFFQAVFAQMMPSGSLRLLQPNGGQRLQSGAEYMIRWTGLDSTRLVSLKYSPDNGKTWKRIADSVRGTEYLWKPIPNDATDSALVRVSGMAGDSTVPVQRRMVQYQVEGSSLSGYGFSHSGLGIFSGFSASTEFSPDGTKILDFSASSITTALTGLFALYQANFVVRDGSTGAKLFALPTFRTDSSLVSRSYVWYSVNNGLYPTKAMCRWSPDSKMLASVVNDSTIGIFDGQNGALIRSIIVPARGDKTFCSAVQWTAKGQELLVTVRYTFFYQQSAIGQGDTMRTHLMRFNVASGSPTNTPIEIHRFINTNFTQPNCTFGRGGFGSISNDGERRLTLLNDSLWCGGNTSFQNALVIRSTKDNSLILTLPGYLGLNLTSGYYGGWGGANGLWSPNDSLMIINGNQTIGNQQNRFFPAFIVNTHTGSLIQQFVVSELGLGWYWSHGAFLWEQDSRKILSRRASAGFIDALQIPPQVGSVATGRYFPTFDAMTGFHNSDYSGGWYGSWGGNAWSNTYPFDGVNRNSTLAWSPDGRFIAGYLFEQRRSKNLEDSYINTVGIWDAATGCLTQVFNLPFPDGITDVPKRTFYQKAPQWSADGKRLLLFSNYLHNRRVPIRRFTSQGFVEEEGFIDTRYDGTAIIAPVNVNSIPCQEDQSDAVFTILPRGSIRVSEAAFAPLLCEQTSATSSVRATNFSSFPVLVRMPVIVGTNAADFRITAVNGMPLPQTTDTVATIELARLGGNRTFEITFVPSGLGQRTAELVFTGADGAELTRVALVGQKDSLSLAPDTVRIHFDRVLKNRTTSGSVSITNTSNVLLMLQNQMLQNQNGVPQNNQQVLIQATSTALQQGVSAGSRIVSASGAFVVDSLSPSVIVPGATGRIHITFLRTENEGTVRDSLPLLSCGAGQFTLYATARVVPNEPRLVVDSVVNFGHLVCEASSNASLRLSNEGGRPLRVFFVGSSDPAQFQASTPTGGITVEPFASFVVPLVFTPNALKSSITTASLVINSDDLAQPRVFVRLEGRKSVQSYDWGSNRVDFGNVGFGQSRTQTVQFINISDAALRWQQLPERLNDDFVIERVEPNPIPPNSPAQVTVRFLGRRDASVINAALEWQLNDACSTATRLSFAARVLDPQPRIVVSDTIRLGTLLCEAESRATVTIRNIGDANLFINSVQVEAEHREDFPKDSVLLSATTLRPNDTTTMRIYFRPLATGNRSATLILKTNDTATARNGEIRIALLGRKDSVSFALPRSEVNVRTVSEFTPLFDTLLVRNTGTAALRWLGSFPRLIDTTFIVERVEPAEILADSTAQVIVRFPGGSAGLRAERTFRLEGASVLNSTCIRTQTLSLRGEVVREPRLFVLQPAPIRLLCENTTTLTVSLSGIGTDDVILQSPVLNSNPNNIFRIVFAPSRLNARTGRDSIVLAASTRQTGVFVAELRIRSNATNLPDTTLRITLRKDSSGVQVIPQVLNFGGLAGNVSESRMITLVNTGTILQSFPLPQRRGSFVLETLSANPIPAGASAQGVVQFLGGTGGILRDTLRLIDSCGRVAALPLETRVVAASAVLPDSIAIEVGAIEESPVFLRNRSGVEAGMEAAFRLFVQNSSLLEIVSPSPESSRFVRLKEANGRETVGQVLSFKTSISAVQETEPILRLRMRSLLGSATTTTILLDSVRIGGVLQQGANTAYYRTKGVNFAGGAPRLISSPNLTALAIAPNPVNDKISLHLTLLKPASVLVELTDIVGRKHLLHEAQILHKAQTGDFHTLELSTSHIASGAYLLTVRSGVEQISKMITIIR